MPDRLSPEAQVALDAAQRKLEASGQVWPRSVMDSWGRKILADYTDSELLAELARRLGTRP